MTTRASWSRPPRFPTIGEQLYQLASGTLTSAELVRRSLRAIAVGLVAAAIGSDGAGKDRPVQ